jgi:hypothetical protein
MNWDALGAIAEMIGAAGLVVTLGYLAIQIRRSNLLSMAESERFSQHASSPTILAIVQDPDVARLFREGLGNRDSLSSDDRVRFDMLLGNLIGGMSAAIAEQERLGHRGDFGTSDQRESVRAFLGAPGGASWWADYQRRYSPLAQATVEEILRPDEPPDA